MSKAGSKQARQKRESLRSKGQFWTPDWVADFMVYYVLQDNPSEIFDPAVGEGAFFRAAKKHNNQVQFYGCEIDPEALTLARQSGLSEHELEHIELRDFVLDPPTRKYSAIVANPPYIRHHRLNQATKSVLHAFAFETTQKEIDGRAGLHVYFLLRALKCLAKGGKLAFIVSADICEGVFADVLWSWVCTHYNLNLVITFTQNSTPFPDVDTNAIILLISNETPGDHITWVRCYKETLSGLTQLIQGNLVNLVNLGNDFEIHHRSIKEALETGLSRNPAKSVSTYKLGDFAKVIRGVVTGNNNFFFLTSLQARKLGIEKAYLVRAIGRTRDIHSDKLTIADMDHLDASGRPTWLLNINGFPFDKLPDKVKEYIQYGEAIGLTEKTLIKTRNPWYRMETRRPPELLFTYLGRRNSRFIRNYAGVIPLTCLLCVYPITNDAGHIDKLWKALSHPDTVKNLSLVGKSYGGGAIKVEPRALERLPIPDYVVEEFGLTDLLAQAQQKFQFED